MRVISAHTCYSGIGYVLGMRVCILIHMCAHTITHTHQNKNAPTKARESINVLIHIYMSTYQNNSGPPNGRDGFETLVKVLDSANALIILMHECACTC